MEKLTFYKIATVVLLLLNTATLGFLLTRRPPPPPGSGAFHFLVKSTGMDDIQQEQYRQLRDLHRSQMDSLREQGAALRSSMYDNKGNQEGREGSLATLADAIAALKRREELLTYEHFRQVRAICRPDQQEKFDAAIQEAVRSMSPMRRK